MKKVILSLSVAMLLSGTALFASESGASYHDSKLYVVAKGLVTTGDTVDHGHDIELDGDNGKGFGIDLGYKLTHNIALEFVSSYATNTVTETDMHDPHHPHIVEADASYMTYGLALAYVFHATDKIGIVVKGGYEIEEEEIEDFHIDKKSYGGIYAIGAEYKLSSNYELLVEYEGSSIEGPRGVSIFAGVKYNF